MDIRTATADDLDAIVDIASIVDPPADGADLDVAYYEHLLRHGRVSVAEAVRHRRRLCRNRWKSTVPGTSATCSSTSDARGGGIGRALLDEVWDADAGSVSRQTFSSLHPAALPLYVRAGMVPRWPLLYLHGSAGRLPAPPLSVEAIDPVVAAGHEREWLGWDRHVEYGYWAKRAGARTFVVLDGISPIAVGCTVRNRSVHTLGRLAAVDASVMPEALAVAGAVVRRRPAAVRPRCQPRGADAGRGGLARRRARSLLRERAGAGGHRSSAAAPGPALARSDVAAAGCTGRTSRNGAVDATPSCGTGLAVHSSSSVLCRTEVFGHVGELCRQS